METQPQIMPLAVVAKSVLIPSSFRKGLFHFCYFLEMLLGFGGLSPLGSKEIVLHVTFCYVELLL